MFVPWFLLFFCFGFVFGKHHTLERYVINSTQSGGFTNWINHLHGLTADPPEFKGLCDLLEKEIGRRFAIGRESIAICLSEPEFPSQNQEVFVNLYVYKSLIDPFEESDGLNFGETLEKQINKPNERSFIVTKMETIETAYIIKGFSYVQKLPDREDLQNEEIREHITSNLKKYCTDNFDQKPILQSITTAKLYVLSHYVDIKLIFESSKMATEITEDDYECKIDESSNETSYLNLLKDFEYVGPVDVVDWTTVPKSMQLYGFEVSKVVKTEYQDWKHHFESITESVSGDPYLCAALKRTLGDFQPTMCEIVPRFPEQNTTVTVKLYYDKNAFNRTNGNCVKTITERLMDLLDANRTEFDVNGLSNMGPLYQYKINAYVSDWTYPGILTRDIHIQAYEHFKTNWIDDLFIKPVIFEISPNQLDVLGRSLDFDVLYPLPGMHMEIKKRFGNVEKEEPDEDTYYISEINNIEAIQPLLYNKHYIKMQCVKDEPDRKTDETTETISIGSTSTKNENDGRPITKPEALQSPTPSEANISKTTGNTKPVTKSTTKPVTKSTTKPVTKSTTKPVTKSTTKPVTKSTTKPVTKSTTKPVTKSTTKPISKSTTKPITKSTTKRIPPFKPKSTSTVIYAFGSTNMVVGAYILFHFF